MKLDEIEVGDVLVTVRREIVCVMEVKSESANPIRFEMKVGKRYQAKPNFFVSKIGTFDTGAVRTAMETQFGGLDSPREPKPGSSFLPAALREMGIKAGDTINVRHGASTREAVFVGYYPQRPRYPISYTVNGKMWKGTEGSVIGKAL